MWNMQEVKICRLLIFDLFLEDNPINCYDLFTEFVLKGSIAEQ